MRVNMPFANVYPCEDAKVPLIKSSNFIYSVKALYLKILLPFFSLTTGANKTTIKNTCMHMHMCKHIYIIKIKKKGDYGGVRGTRGHTLQVHQMKTPVTSSWLLYSFVYYSLFYCLLHLFQFYVSEINIYHRNIIKIKNHLLYASQNLMPLFIIRVA